MRQRCECMRIPEVPRAISNRVRGGGKASVVAISQFCVSRTLLLIHSARVFDLRRAPARSVSMVFLAENSNANEVDSGDACHPLSEEQRAVLKLAYFEEKAHPEIAEALDIPLGTVKSRIRLALKNIRSKIGDNQ